jgi:hypothetical protein
LIVFNFGFVINAIFTCLGFLYFSVVGVQETASITRRAHGQMDLDSRGFTDSACLFILHQVRKRKWTPALAKVVAVISLLLMVDLGVA